MADHSVISTEPDQATPALPTTALTRRSLLGGAGIAVGTVLAARRRFSRSPRQRRSARKPGTATARRGDEAPCL